MKEGGKGRASEGRKEEGREGERERGVRERKWGKKGKKNVEEGRILSSTLEIVVLHNYLHCVE